MSQQDQLVPPGTASPVSTTGYSLLLLELRVWSLRVSTLEKHFSFPKYSNPGFVLIHHLASLKLGTAQQSVTQPLRTDYLQTRRYAYKLWRYLSSPLEGINFLETEQVLAST